MAVRKGYEKAKFSVVVVVVVFNGISLEFFLDGGSLGPFWGGSSEIISCFCPKFLCYIMHSLFIMLFLLT